MQKIKTFRLIIEDSEEVVEWASDIDKSLVRQLFTYINDQLRKKYSTDTFSYRDFENEHYQLHDIVEFEISPVYMTIPHRKDIQTFRKDNERKFKTVYRFKNAMSILKQKFEDGKQIEDSQIDVDAMKSTNDKYRTERFEDSILSANTNTNLNNPLSIKIQPNTTKDDDDGEVSPTFGGASSSSNGNNFLKPANLVTDAAKRMIKPTAGGDGKSQSAFMLIAEQNKYPLGKPVELQHFTIEDVKKHNRSTDAWMVLNGKVYDVTKYIPYHPGGKKVLMGVGKDGTQLFNEYHPWVNPHFMLEKYQIGFLKK